MVFWGRVLCPALSLLGSFYMIRLLPKIMMLASSAVLSSVPSVTPGDWYKEVSDNISSGLCFGFVSEDVGSYVGLQLRIGLSDDLFADFYIDSFQVSNGYWGVSSSWSYDYQDPVTSLYTYEVLSLVNFMVSLGEDYYPLLGWWQIDENNEVAVSTINAVSLVGHFVIDGTIDFVIDPGMGDEGIVTIPKVVGLDAVPVYSLDVGGNPSLDFLPFYQADYSDSATDVLGAVTDVIGEMGNGLADGVEEATALFYADGSFTTLGILTLLTCGVALVFWAFYLIRKYLYVGVK